MSDQSLRSALIMILSAYLIVAGVGIYISGLPRGWNLLACALLFVTLLALSAIDLKTYRLPNYLTLPLIALGLGWQILTQQPLWNYIIGGLIGYLLIYGLNLYWRRAYGKDGIGLGDAKLLAGAGVWLGATSLPYVLLVSSGAALCVHSLAKLKPETKKSDYVAFGPYIAIGLWSVWWLEPILS